MYGEQTGPTIALFHGKPVTLPGTVLRITATAMFYRLQGYTTTLSRFKGAPSNLAPPQSRQRVTTRVRIELRVDSWLHTG